MSTKQELITKYTKAIQKGNAAIFAGAGLSRSSGFVDWKTLLSPLASEIGLDINKESDLISLAQYYKNERRTRGSINQEIVDKFTKETELNENITILTELPIDTYWTTNYDHLLEEGLRKANRLVDVKTDSKQLSITKKDRDAVLYKMHGDADNPADAILTKDDYETYENKRPLFRTALQGDLISKTFLFIGFSFEDPNLDYILSSIHVLLGENKRDHYCFFKSIEKKPDESDEDFTYRKVKQKLRTEDLQRYGIQAVFVDKYEEITDILNKIAMAIKLNNVFISGSAEEYTLPWSETTAEHFVYSLANNLVKKDYTIICGFGHNIGSSVVNGALDEIYSSKYKHINEYLCLRPFPYGITDTTERKEKFTQYRRDMLSQAGIVIFMFGNKKGIDEKIIDATGCKEEFEIAKEYKKYIIPIGSTGYAADTIWQEIKKNITEYPYLTDYIDDLKSITESDKLIELIMKILCKIKGDV